MAHLASATTEESQQIMDAAFGNKLSFWVRLGLIATPVIVFFVSFMLGKYPVSPPELIKTMYWHFVDPARVSDIRAETVIFQVRLPRTLLSMLVGAALSVAGAAYQGMFKNPLVSPDILGASAGAAFGACLGILWGFSLPLIQLTAFAFSLLAVGCALWINRSMKYDPILGLVLGGILVSTMFQAGLSIIKYAADADEKLPTITFWLMGGFSSVVQRDVVVAILPLLLGFTLLMSQRWKLNVLSFGEEEARTLGINTRVTRLIVIAGSTLLTAISVAIGGMIGWIGLVIPHLGRAVVGPNYRVLLPVCMTLGATYLLFVDDLARLLLSVEIPIGILTSLLGVPFFLIIFKKNMGGWR